MDGVGADNSVARQHTSSTPEQSLPSASLGQESHPLSQNHSAVCSIQHPASWLWFETGLAGERSVFHLSTVSARSFLHTQGSVKSSAPFPYHLLPDVANWLGLATPRYGMLDSVAYDNFRIVASSFSDAEAHSLLEAQPPQSTLYVWHIIVARGHTLGSHRHDIADPSRPHTSCQTRGRPSGAVQLTAKPRQLLFCDLGLRPKTSA
jgi:hypothetical protein